VVLSDKVPEGVPIEEVLAEPRKFSLEVYVIGKINSCLYSCYSACALDGNHRRVLASEMKIAKVIHASI